MHFINTQCYATRLLNPFRGVAHIIDNGQARAKSTDGVNWRIQICSGIYKTPWTSLLIPGQTTRDFDYGVWSQAEGLARLPVHPSLYQEHVEQAVEDLLAQLVTASEQLPFPFRDSIELWAMDAAGRQPVALLASQQADEMIPVTRQLHWTPTENSETPFHSKSFSDDQARLTVKLKAQDYLLRAIRHRCQLPFQGIWLERLGDGSGVILQDQAGKHTRRNDFLPADTFPCCLLDENWDDVNISRLVTDYICWLAPLLLMLPLSASRRRELELSAQQRPLAVHRYYRLYPEVIDERLLNKILVEAVMRKATMPT